MTEPFDIFKESQIFKGDVDQYLKFLNSYFDVCHNKKVLEIGPSSGAHTKEIVKNSPSYLEVIEGYEPCIKALENITEIDKVVFGDAMKELTIANHFDVVICFGVLYHLHSPLHLIELIVNNCRPKYLMLDCVFEREQITVLDEEIGIPGSCQTQKNWKSCGVNIVIPFLTYKQCLEKMGYELSKTHILNVSTVSKTNSWLATWILKENNDKSIS